MSTLLAQYLTNYANPNSLGSRIRRRRFGPLMGLIDEAYRRHGEVKILDIGGLPLYWSLMPRDFLVSRRARITLLNITAPEEGRPSDLFEMVTGDGCALPYPDKSFHIAHSNSVIEHVGGWPEMQRFARELVRVAESHFVQTPNFWFPVEPHFLTPFFHWLPQPVRVALVMRFELGNLSRQATVSDAVTCVDSARLLDRRMFKALFPTSEVTTERLLFLPKSLIGVGHAT